MKRHRLVFAALVTGIGLLQARDSGAFSAGSGIIALVLLAIAIPVGAFLVESRSGILGLSIIAAFALALTARILSPVRLPELLLVAYFPAMLLIFRGLAGAKEMERTLSASGRSGPPAP